LAFGKEREKERDMEKREGVCNGGSVGKELRL